MYPGRQASIGGGLYDDLVVIGPLVGIGLLVAGLVGAFIGSTKGRPGVGFLLGLLGPIGWTLLAVAIVPLVPETDERSSDDDDALRAEIERTFPGATRSQPEE